MEPAPANTPARPAIRISGLEFVAPATPIVRLRMDTSPSFAPSTAARRALPPLALWRPSSWATVPPGNPPLDWEAIASKRAWDFSSWENSLASSSGWPSYVWLSAFSLPVMVGSTNCGPNRFASQIMVAARQVGLRGGKEICISASFFSQAAACFSSLAASLLYTSAIWGCFSNSAKTRYNAAPSISFCRLATYRFTSSSLCMISTPKKSSFWNLNQKELFCLF